jgi:hypothetical protein
VPDPIEQERRTVGTIFGVGGLMAALFIWGLFQSPVFKGTTRDGRR